MMKYDIFMLSYNEGEWRCLCPDVPIKTLPGLYEEVLGQAKSQVEKFAEVRQAIGLRLPPRTVINPQILQIYTRGSKDYKVVQHEVVVE